MRKENSIKNFLTSFLPYIILAVLGFLKLDIFLNSLGEEVYALNQLFLQIFAYVSMADAGIGTLIVQRYYSLFESKDNDAINKIYNGSRKYLKKIMVKSMD